MVLRLEQTEPYLLVTGIITRLGFALLLVQSL